MAELPPTDVALLESAERATAADGVPTTLARLRRRRLRHHDALSTTWEAWDTESGRPALLKVLRPRWRAVPAMVRRFERQTNHAALCAFGPCNPAPIHHRVLDSPGIPLSAVFPLSDEPAVSLPERAAAFAFGLAGLQTLHADSRSLGAPVAEWLTVGPAGPRLLDTDHFGAPFDPHADLRSLADAVLRLAPEATDPIATLARTWTERPPPTADDAAVLVRRAMAAHLARLRHQLARSRRMDHKAHRLGHLSRLLGRLAAVERPPVGSACLAVTDDGLHVMVRSDGRTLLGGPVPSPVHEELPLVWSADGGLDPVAARLLMRAWSQRQTGQDDRREAVHAALGSSATDAGLVVRWLSAARRLRSARLLLDAEARFSVVR